MPQQSEESGFLTDLFPREKCCEQASENLSNYQSTSKEETSKFESENVNYETNHKGRAMSPTPEKIVSKSKTTSTPHLIFMTGIKIFILMSFMVIVIYFLMPYFTEIAYGSKCSRYQSNYSDIVSGMDLPYEGNIERSILAAAAPPFLVLRALGYY